MTCNKPNCNQGHCDCEPMFKLHDNLIIIIEAALIAAMATMGVLAWRLW